MSTRSSIALVAVVGAVLGLVGTLVMPQITEEAGPLAAIADAPAPFLIGTAFTFIAAALIGVALIVIGNRSAANGHRVTAVLTYVAAFGWLLHTALIAHNAVMLPLAQAADAEAATEIAALVYAGPVFVGLLIPMLVTTVLGTIAAAFALWRTGQASLWSAIVLTVALIADFVLPDGMSGVAMFALLAVGFAGVWLGGARKDAPVKLEVPVA